MMARIIEPSPRNKQYRCLNCQALYEVDLLEDGIKGTDFDDVVVLCPSCKYPKDIDPRDLTLQVRRKLWGEIW